MPEAQSTHHRLEPWNDSPERLPEGFQAIRLTAGRAVPATCEVWTSPFGWELRLILDGAMLIASVVPSAAEMRALVESWHGALVSKGWQ